MPKNEFMRRFPSFLNPEENDFKSKLNRSKSAPQWLTFFGQLNKDIKKNLEPQKVEEKHGWLNDFLIF